MGFNIYWTNNNPYGVSSNYNAVFTFSKPGVYIIDPLTGNFTKPLLGDVDVVTANLVQEKDPNLELQPGLDYNRIYFSGYLVEPKVYPGALQSKGIVATINGRNGTFDFTPFFQGAEASAINAESVSGQRIGGYFRLT